MINKMKAASALGAKTARACDSCLRIRARWFCAADDAFLCHACDNLVHSANQLASRHERVHLQTVSSKVNYSVTPKKVTAQAWHSGFTRKARTPRHNKHLLVQQQPKNEEEEEEEVLFNNTITLPLVPELGSEEPLLDDETEEQLLCRVPVFDPFDSELCSIYNEVKDERLDTTMKNDVADEEAFDLDNFSEFLPSDMDLAEFAADVESLLENGLDEESGDMKGSELLDCKEEDEIDAHVGVGAKSAMVKVKDEEHDGDTACHHLEPVLDMTSEAFNWNIDSESLAAAALAEEEKVVVPVVASGSAGKVGTKKEIFLRLNYEEVIAAWASQNSPWTTENPPKFNSDDCWPDYLVSSGADVQCSNVEVRSLREHPIGSADGGREARVSRYREKRRTRLFAKKVRYEVRKLNAEKRPRMKGRFVKRTTSFVGATAFPA